MYLHLISVKLCSRLGSSSSHRVNKLQLRFRATKPESGALSCTRHRKQDCALCYPSVGYWQDWDWDHAERPVQ